MKGEARPLRKCANAGVLVRNCRPPVGIVRERETRVDDAAPYQRECRTLSQPRIAWRVPAPSSSRDTNFCATWETRTLAHWRFSDERAASGFPGGTPRPSPTSAGGAPVDNEGLPGELRSITWICWATSGHPGPRLLMTGRACKRTDHRRFFRWEPASPAAGGRTRAMTSVQNRTGRGPVLQCSNIHCIPVMVVTRARRRRWQVQEAKARFDAVVRAASTLGPQTITVSGRRAAVVLSPEDYDRLKRPRLSLADFMARSPLVGVELDLERDRSLPGDRGP